LSYISDNENKYLYQGKEYQDDLVDNNGTTSGGDIYLNWYDFNARYFDPQLGRWHVPDPVNQYPSSYVGMGNNPISMTDPDGLKAIWSQWEFFRRGRTFSDDPDGHGGRLGSVSELVSLAGGSNNLMASIESQVFENEHALAEYESAQTRFQFWYECKEEMRLAAYWNEISKESHKIAQGAGIINSGKGKDMNPVFFTDENAAYQYIWDCANDNDIEYAAILTQQGVLVCPTYLNTSTTGDILGYFETRWQGDALFLKYKDEKLQVFGAIHTQDSRVPTIMLPIRSDMSPTG